MKTVHSKRCGGLALPVVEVLEDRRLFSMAMPAAALAPVASTAIPPVGVSTSSLIGDTINAEANEPFKAVIGTIRGLVVASSAYTLEGSIDWGDGTGPSAATFVRGPRGIISVLGGHTYTAVGTDAITITVTENPPAGSAAPVILVGQIHSKAAVISSGGGVTVEAASGVPFTAGVGFFSSNLSSLTMTATINWGDGTSSVGKILALPTAGLVGRFEVVGSHVYSLTQSYVVQVIVTALVPPPTSATQGTPPTQLVVASIDSVIDVLPVSPTAVA